MGERVAIVGIGQTVHQYRREDVNAEELVNEAVRRALEDAQLTIKDIDAVCFTNMDLFEGHYLADSMLVDGGGAWMKPGFKINTGGSTGGAVVSVGWQHVASGLFNKVLVIGWQKQDAASSISALVTAREPLYDRWLSAGAAIILAAFGLNYMRETSCPEEIAALARVIASEGASRNPYAHLRRVLTVEEVMKSRVIVWPLRLLHISPTSCGSCALILANETHAKKITNKPVWIKDIVIAHREASVLRGGGIEPIPGPDCFEVACRKLYKRNGIVNPAKEIDVWEPYIPSSWSDMPFMEWHYMCEKGEAWKLIERGATRIDGDMPVNPSGGVVSTNPIGASGTIRVAEAALQIRGDAGEHQVTRKDVKTALADAWGGPRATEVFLLTKLL